MPSLGQEVSNQAPALRLKRLRETLQLSQRELAKEFSVSAGAIALWEQGARPVPGPVIRLLSLYEQHLSHDLESRSHQHHIRKISATWTERILSSFRPGKVVHPRLQPGLRQGLQESLVAYLKGMLSTDQVKRSIQVALANRLVESLGTMKGLPMKAAQMATYLDPTMPPELREIIATLQVLSPPMAPSVASRVIFEELGSSPAKLFAEWTPKPFAAASIGQVHLARLHTGERVAVKVQYPGIAESVRADCRTLSFLGQLSSLLGADAADMIEEITQRLNAECDYRQEADFQEKFRTHFANDPQVVIPRVFTELSSRRVLTMEYVDGQSYRDFLTTATPEARNRAGETLCRFYRDSIFRLGLMHADPHAGNFLYLKDRVAFVDFGRIAPFEPETRRQTCRLFQALLTDDPESARGALQSLRLVRDWESFDFPEFWNLLRQQQAHHLHAGPFRFTPEYVAGIARATRTYSQRRHLRMTRDFFWSGCMHQALWNMLAELGAESDWRASTLEALGSLT